MLQRLVCLTVGLAALSASSCAPSLAAKPHLVAAWPRPGATLSVGRHTFDLTFNHRLNADASSAVVLLEGDGSATPAEVSLDPANTGRLRIRLLEPAEGAYELHWHAVDAQSGAAADGDQAFTIQDEAAKPARLDVSPGKADKEEPLELVGKGFASHSRVQLTIADDEQPLASVETDEAGRFNIEAKIPSSVPFGVQPVSATDATGRNAMGALEVRWGGWPPVVATTAGQPGPAPGEVTFTVHVRNGSDYMVEHVRLVVTDPDDSALIGADPPPRRDGRTLTWIIPVLDRGLVGPFRATYRTTTPVIGKAWLEFRHRHIGSCARDDCLPAFISESVAESQPVAPAD